MLESFRTLTKCAICAANGSFSGQCIACFGKSKPTVSNYFENAENNAWLKAKTLPREKAKANFIKLMLHVGKNLPKNGTDQ